MNVFRKRGQLCDVVIKVGGQEFLAHRVVLAATSDYFDAMFSNGVSQFIVFLLYSLYHYLSLMQPFNSSLVLSPLLYFSF